MNVILVDDEKIALSSLKLTLEKLDAIETISTFREPHAALQYLKETGADAAFLDIQMRQMDGLSLAKQVKEVCPDCAIVFVTGYSEYAVPAFAMHANGYLLKPVRESEIQRELAYIQTQFPHPSKPDKSPIRVRCFGNFEVYSEGTPLVFRYQRTKELLAYLIDRRGAYCTNHEIIGVLWENQTMTSTISSQFRNLVADLVHTLAAAGMKNAVLRRRGQIAILPEAFQCDYFDWLDGSLEAINAYRGEYLMQYSWSEFSSCFKRMEAFS